MSNRKLRTITIAATMRHEARGLTARSRRRKRPAMSTLRVYDHHRRKRDRRGGAHPRRRQYRPPAGTGGLRGYAAPARASTHLDL
jgi:hypothetical protein